MALTDIAPVERNEDGIAAVLGILKQRFGEAFQTSEALRQQHAHTTTYIPAQMPDGVLFATSSGDVQAAVEVCAAHKVPIIPFGTGSSLEGGVNAPGGGISVDLNQMNQILSVNAEDLDCVVQPGVTREDLNTYLRDTGLFFPIDPGANASIGGMAATRASGTNAVRYGTMKDSVLSLEVILPNGRKITTAQRARKSSAGYDLTRLMVGSEGTLGIITEITLRLHGIPQAITSGVCPFPTLDAAVQAVIMTIQMGLPVARIELVNALQMSAMVRYSGLEFDETPSLFLEFHGTDAGVAEQAEIFGEIAADLGGGPFHWSGKEEERKKLWQARHDAYWSGLSLRPGAKGIATDVCVPISRLADCIAETEEDIAENGLIAPIVGHAGDGNFHVLLLLNEEDPAEVSGVEEFVARLNSRALQIGGTCTGEHGIGQGKMGFLEMELGGAVDVMRTIKRAIDPNNIMNPGKVVRI